MLLKCYVYLDGKALPFMDLSAVMAVMRWTFQPGTSDGNAVALDYDIKLQSRNACHAVPRRTARFAQSAGRPRHPAAAPEQFNSALASSARAHDSVFAHVAQLPAATSVTCTDKKPHLDFNVE
jgi:hypothetical protein